MIKIEGNEMDLPFIPKKQDFNSTVASLLAENNIFNIDYYILFHESVGLISNLYNTDRSKVKTLFLKKIDELKTMLRVNNAPDLLAVSTFLDLILYPLYLDINLRNKTYKSFNIDIEFFNLLKNKNAMKFYEQEADDVLTIKSFKFDEKNKLNGFVLNKHQYNLSYEYDSKYNCVNMIFPDGSNLDLRNLDKNAKKKTNKSN